MRAKKRVGNKKTHGLSQDSGRRGGVSKEKKKKTHGLSQDARQTRERMRRCGSKKKLKKKKEKKKNARVVPGLEADKREDEAV